MNSIICAAFNNWELTKVTVESIMRSCREPYRLIVVNNGSTDRTAEWMSEFARDVLLPVSGGNMIAGSIGEVRWEAYGKTADTATVILVHSPVNEGCGIGRNIGLRVLRQIGSSKYVTFIDNDIVATDGWDTEMIKFMDQHDDIGLCGPMTNFAGTPQKLEPTKFNLPQKIEEVEQFASSFKRTYSQKWSYVPNGFVVIGFCMMMKQRVFLGLADTDGNLFDERFKYYGKEDNDLCVRVIKAGMRMAYFGGCYIHHWGSKSLEALAASGVDWGKHWRENDKVFDEKWKR